MDAQLAAAFNSLPVITGVQYKVIGYDFFVTAEINPVLDLTLMVGSLGYKRDQNQYIKFQALRDPTVSMEIQFPGGDLPGFIAWLDNAIQDELATQMASLNG